MANELDLARMHVTEGGWTYFYEHRRVGFGNLYWENNTGDTGEVRHAILEPENRAALLWKGRFYRLHAEQQSEFDPIAYRAEFGGPLGGE